MSADKVPGGTPNEATEYTRQENQRFGGRLNFENTICFEDAARGFVGTIPDARVTSDDGRVVWDVSAYRFLEQEQAPDSVNPSLWRQARLNNFHGLFEVAVGIYQVRGLDIANMTIIEGDSGVILIDPLMNSETAKAAFELYCALIEVSGQSGRLFSVTVIQTTTAAWRVSSHRSKLPMVTCM